MTSQPKAQIVQMDMVLPANWEAASDGVVVHITVSASGSHFEISTQAEGVVLMFPVMSEVGVVISQLFGTCLPLYCRAFQRPEGLCFEGKALEGLTW